MTDLRATPASRSNNTRLYAILGVAFGLAFPVLATAVHLAAADLPFTWPNILLAQSQPLMWIIDTAPVFLGALAAVAGRQQDSVEAGRFMLAEQARELRAGQQELEARVAERTREFEERRLVTRQAIEATRQLSRLDNVSELVISAVQRTAELAPGYTVDLYLIDERRQDAVRAASSDEAETEPISVPIGDARLVGQVAASGEAGRISAPALGEEMAFPLLVRGTPLGVLHLRPADPGARAPSEHEAFQLIADQLAAAIETSRLSAQSREAHQQLQTMARQTAQATWRAEAPSGSLAYEFTPAGTRSAPKGASLAEPGQLRIPLELRGQRIGTISLSRSKREGWTDADRDLAQKTAAQVALALENIRLLEETRARALQEQRLSDFSAKLGQAVDLDTLLQTAVRELADFPEVAEAAIYLNPAAADQTVEPS